MARIDYVNDPNAPHPTRLVPAVTVYVTNADGDVLLIERSDNGLWAMPGGQVDLGESVAQTAEREVREETGYEVCVRSLAGIYSDPGHVIAYSDGEVRQQFTLSVRADLLGGTLRTSEETPQVRWVAPKDIGALPMADDIRQRLQDATNDGAVVR